MKKKMIGAMVALMALTGATALNAQNPENCNRENCNRTECPQQAGCPERTCPERPDGQTDRPGPRLSGRPDATRAALRGLELTEEQKAQLQALKTPRQASEDQMRQARRDYLDGLKQILTPEQYVQFLENYYMHTQQPSVGQGRHHAPRGPRAQGHRNHRHGNERQERPAAARR